MKQIRIWAISAAAAFVVLSLAAASASAAVEFHTSAPGASLTGHQMEGAETLTIGSNEASCSTSKFSGKFPASKTSATMELHPEYSGCKAFGLTATVNTAGCELKLYAATKVFDITSCTAGGITLTASEGATKCTVLMPNNTGITESAIGGTGLKKLIMWVKGHVHIGPASVVTSTGACPLKAGSEVEVTYNGITDIAANGEAAELWIE